VLSEARIATARGLVAATDDDQINVEIALTARSLGARGRVAVRTFDPRFRENVAYVLPGANVLCASTLAASAYAAAALGEQVIQLFQTPQAAVLVVEYTVTEGDTLAGRSLGQVAEGYAVVPVLHRRKAHAPRVPSPDDLTVSLTVGDQLVLLATQSSLERIERGELLPASYQLHLRRTRPYAEPVELVGLLRHWLGYSLEQGHAVLERLPHVSPPLYGRHAVRSARALDASGLETHVERVEAPPP
jgi:Trk K+ transport system NAD-binding subunit